MGDQEAPQESRVHSGSGKERVEGWRRSVASVRLAVLLPVKGFGAAKARMADHLTPAERERLARTTAERVVSAACGLATFVVCDDDEVASWSRAHGAEPIESPRRGLNAAVADGVQTLAGRGFTTVLVAHADLPLADDLRRVASPIGVTIVPDRADDGSNVLVIPAAVGFTFAYGAGSFRRHAVEATRLGLPVRVVRDPLLGVDLDTPADLANPLVRKAMPWLPMSPANQQS